MLRGHEARLHRRLRSSSRVAALRAAVPDVSITTDLIVGFPGESEDDFAETLDLVEAAASTRPSPSSTRRARGTAAATCRGR